MKTLEEFKIELSKIFAERKSFADVNDAESQASNSFYKITSLIHADYYHIHEECSGHVRLIVKRRMFDAMYEVAIETPELADPDFINAIELCKIRGHCVDKDCYFCEKVHPSKEVVH